MTVRLRAHHLLCMLTYVGKGYSPAFVANYDAIAARLNAGEDILVIEGPDDICAPLLAGADPHCLGASVDDRDRRAAQDVALLLDQPVATGTRISVSAALLHRLRSGFAQGLTRNACLGCEWSDLCSTVAAGGFASVRLSGREA